MEIMKVSHHVVTPKNILHEITFEFSAFYFDI